MDSRERSVSPTASKMACSSTSAKSHGSTLTHPDTLDNVKVADTSVDKAVASVPSLPVCSPPLTPSSACASAAAWTPSGAACAAQSNGSVAPATIFAAAAAAARDHFPATTARPAPCKLVDCETSSAAARRRSSVVASPAVKLPAATQSDSPAAVVDPYPTAASPQSVERDALPPNGDASPAPPPAADSAPATCSVPSIGCSLHDAAFTCAAAPSVTVPASAAATLIAAAGIQESRNGEAHAPVEDLRPEASTAPTLPREADTVLVAVMSTRADAAVACPEGMRSEETMVCPHSLSVTSKEHSRHIHDSSSEGVASSSVLAEAAAAPRCAGSAITAEHANVEGKDWPVEDQSGPAAELPVDASCTAVNLAGTDLRPGATTAAAGAHAGNMPPTEIDLRIGGAGANSSEKQIHPTAGDTSPSTVLDRSTANCAQTAAGHTYSAAPKEVILSAPAAAEVGVLQAATTPARCGEDSVRSTPSKMSMQREQPHFLLEQQHRDSSSWKEQQQEEHTSDPQQGNDAASMRVRHRSASRERGLSLTLGQDEGNATCGQRLEAPPIHAHQAGAFSSVELRGENGSSLLWRRAGASPSEHLQKHSSWELQEADAPIPEQQHEYVHSPAPRQNSVSARGDKLQEQHGLETLLHSPLASLAELVSSPSPLGLSLTCSLGTSLLSKTETEQQQNSTVADETQQQHHELQQEPSQQQLLTSAGDLLWKMGRRIGSGSRAAAEAAASAAAKAASVAAVATIGEPTVVTVLPKGSVESHSTLFGAELCKQTGDDSSGGDDSRWTATRGGSSKASSDNFWSSIKNPTSNGADTTVKRCSNNGSSGADSSALHNSSDPSTAVSNGSRSSSSGFHKGSSPRASPSASDIPRTRVLDEELLQERDALRSLVSCMRVLRIREQVRKYQETLTQLLEPPAQSQSSPRDRIDQDKQQQEVAASVDGGRLRSPSIATPSKEKQAVSGAETQSTDTCKSFTRRKVRVRGAGLGRGRAAGDDAPESAASSVDAAAAAPVLKDAVAASASSLKGATGAGPSVVSDSGGNGLSATAGGTCERGRRAGRDLGAHTSVSQDMGWSAADAVEQLQQQLVELLCERAASAAAVAATTAAEATFSALLGTRRGDQRIDTAAVAAATSVALTEDEELVRLLWQLLKQAACSVHGKQSDVFPADRHSCKEPAALLATLPTSEIDASLQHAPPHRRTRSGSNECQRRVYSSRRGRSSTDKRVDKQGNSSDGTGSNRSESKGLGSSSYDRHFALDACERQQFLAKIQQQQLELEQYRDINERQTKQLMQLTLQLTSFKTEADNRDAAEQLERAWHSPEKEESAASSDAEKHEELAAIDAQQQQLEELAAAAAESFGLKCHLQELSKMYTKAAEREAALRQELEDLRLQLTQQQQQQQQQQSTRLQEDRGLAAKRRPQQDLRTEAAKREAQENEEFTEGATTTRRISPFGTPNQEIKRSKNRVATTADDEAIGTTLMGDMRVQTTEVAHSLPPAIYQGARSGDSEVLLTQKAERLDETLQESSRSVSSADATQLKGTADRERRATAAKQGTSVDAAAMLGASVPSYQDTAIGARECLETSPLSIAGEENTTRGATASSDVVPADPALVSTQADAATMYLDGPPSHAKGNTWNVAESRGDNQRKEELDRDQVPDAKCHCAAVSLETPSSAEKLPTAEGSSLSKEKDDKIPGLAQQEEEVEQESDLRIVVQRMRSLEVELESVRTQYSGERRRLQRHMLGLKTLCAKEKQRREKAEAQCERLMAAALEQQAFVLQKTPQREGVICGYAEEDPSISRGPASSPLLPFCTSPFLQSSSVRENRAEASNVVYRMKLPFDCGAYAGESFRNSNVGMTSGRRAAVSPAAPHSAVAPTRRDGHAQQDALANNNDGSDDACSSSIRQWQSTQTGTEGIFLRKSDNLSGAGDALNVQYSETALRARTAWRTASTAEVYWVEEGGLKTATEERKDASTANKEANHSSRAPGLKELQKAYALAQEELQRVQQSQTVLQADVIRKAEIISFLLKKYASEQEGFEAEDVFPCPHSFPWKPLNAASTPMAWVGGKTKAKGLTAAELQNLVEKMLAENIRLRSDLATLGFEFE